MRQPKNRLASAALALILYAGVLAARSDGGVRKVCFENDGLKNRHEVKLVMSGPKISGVYKVEPYDNSEKPIERAFRGTSTRTKTGWLLKVFFPKGAPYELAPNTKHIVWRMGKRGELRVLIVPTYGKNYPTRKYAASEMQLSSCI